MVNQTQISRDSFSKFVGVLKILQNHCVDCEVNQGKIRQATDDKTCFFDIDITNLIGEIDILLAQLKVKVSSFQTFEVDDFVEGAGEEIAFESDGKTYYINDPFTKMKIQNPGRKFLDNTFLSQEEKDKRINVSDDDLVMSVDMSAYIASRIKKICESFSNDVITCQVKDNDAKLILASNNQQNVADITSGIELHDEMPNCRFKLSYLPFSLELNSDVKLRAYKKSSDIILVQFDMNYFDNPVTIYAQCRMEKE